MEVLSIFLALASGSTYMLATKGGRRELKRKNKLMPNDMKDFMVFPNTRFQTCT